MMRGMSETLTGLREAYCNQGKYRQAEKPGRQMLDMRRQQFGDNHLESGMAAHKLAVIYHMQQKYGQAEPLYSQAMSIKTKALGAGHPEVLELLESYADLMMKTNREAEAETLLKCLTAPTPAPATRRPSSTATGLAAVLGTILPMQTADASSSQPKTWELLQQEAEAACTAGKNLEALELLNQAIALAEQFPENDSRLARSLDQSRLHSFCLRKV